MRAAGCIRNVFADTGTEKEQRRTAKTGADGFAYRRYECRYRKADDKKTSLQQKEFDYNVMFILDIDDFKCINDTRGHMEGDEVLKRFAGVLQNTFRSADIIYRLGGR